MKSFFNWPLDGQIAFIGIIVAVLCFLLSDLANRNSVNIEEKSGDFFRMRYKKSSWLIMAGLLIFSTIITYGASKAGYCTLMNIEENTRNKLVAVFLTILIWIGTIMYCYHSFFVKLLFNEESIIKNTPLSRKIFLWEDLSNMEVNWRGFYFDFKNNERLYIPSDTSGLEQFYNILSSKTQRINKPLTPRYYPEETINDFLDKKIIVFIFRLNEMCLLEFIRSEIGIIKNIGQETISILLESGETMSANASSQSIAVFQDELDIDDDLLDDLECHDILTKLVKSGNNPDIIATYYID
ncbi:MAG: hypothetical protein R3D71_10305 [Rickettsiales bacterium]